MANPNKTPEIVEVLSGNKEKLLKYLGDFLTEKGEAPALASHILVWRHPARVPPGRVQMHEWPRPRSSRHGLMSFYAV